MTEDSLVEGLIAEGLSHHRQGRREKALEFYAAGLKALPDHPDALNLVGTLLMELDRREESRPYLERALRCAPRNPEFLNNYGNLLAAGEQPQKARRHYEKAIKLRPGYGEAWRNLARLCALDCGPEEGLQAFRREVLRRRGDAEGHYTLALLLQHYDALEAATESLEAAISANPRHVDAHYCLSIVLHCLDRSEEAIVLLYKVLEIEPGHDRAKHMRDALEGRSTRHAPESYVVALFDNYAPRYDKHLVGALRYHGPELIRAAVQSVAPRTRFERALDLGCGTGLVGRALAGMTGRLEGIDLSAKMIEKAEESGAYDDLQVADIFDYLIDPERAQKPFDLVVSGDVLLYIGDLDLVFAQLVPVMRPGGLFAFTVEEKEEAGDGFALRKTGRYVHRPDYIESAAAAHGLEVLHLESAAVRQQGGKPVMGLVTILRLAGAPGGLGVGDHATGPLPASRC